MSVCRCLVRSVIAAALVVAAAAPIQAAAAILARASVSIDGEGFNFIQLLPPTPGFTGTDNNDLFPADKNPVLGRLEVPVPGGAGFSGLSLFADGAPFLLTPTFKTSTSIFSGSGGTTLRLEFTQTKVTLEGVASEFEFNVLSGSGVSATISSYVDPAGFGFGDATPLFTAPFSGSATANSDTLLGAPKSYSITTVMEITFDGPVGSSSRVSASATLKAIDGPVPVPEPASLALLGAGLLGLGFARRRRAA